MSIWLLATIALVTYASRAAALAFLPRPAGRFEAVLSRMPAPIFASLATLTLVTEEQALAGGSLLTAAAGALLVSPRRSFPLCLVGGISGYAVGELLL
jgi:branched-subunit amino acid transport protein